MQAIHNSPQGIKIASYCGDFKDPFMACRDVPCTIIEVIFYHDVCGTCLWYTSTWWKHNGVQEINVSALSILSIPSYDGLKFDCGGACT